MPERKLPRAVPSNQAKVEPLRRIVGRIWFDKDGRPRFAPKPGHGEEVTPPTHDERKRPQ